MIDQELFQQIRLTSVQERIQILECIIESLKKELVLQTGTRLKPFPKFAVRTYRLGQDVTVDRNELYSETCLHGNR